MWHLCIAFNCIKLVVKYSSLQFRSQWVKYNMQLLICDLNAICSFDLFYPFTQLKRFGCDFITTALKLIRELFWAQIFFYHKVYKAIHTW